MKQVTIQTRSDGPVQVTARYISPGGVFAVTPSYKEHYLFGKWTVTHIPTGRQCIARGMILNRIEDAKVYARDIAKILGPIQTPCDLTQEQVDKINRYVGNREFRTWQPGDLDYPCGDLRPVATPPASEPVRGQPSSAGAILRRQASRRT